MLVHFEVQRTNYKSLLNSQQEQVVYAREKTSTRRNSRKVSKNVLPEKFQASLKNIAHAGWHLERNDKHPDF
jgi:hypothetical protein